MTLDELKIELNTLALELLEAADGPEHPAFKEYLHVVAQLRDLEGVAVH